MDYTTSDANITHAGTGNRMHQDTAPVTTAVTARDMNQVIWSLMKLLQDAGVSAATFNPDTPATYSKVSEAVQAFAVSGLAPHLAAPDPHPQYATTQGTFTPALSFGGAAVGMTYAQRYGWWVKNGKLVSFGCFLELSAKGSATGSAIVTLGSLANAAYQTALHGSVDQMSGLTGRVSGMLVGGSNTVQVRYFDPAAGSEAFIANDTHFTNTSHLYLTGHYLEV